MPLMLESAVRTHVGRVRRSNEDAVFASPRLAAVADGVGGHAAGEVASRVVVNALVELEKSHVPRPVDVALADAVLDGNRAVGFVASRRPECAGMGTTLVAVAVDDDRYVVAGIGDSRTYLLRDDRLIRLTHDDSLVQLLIDEGRLTDDEARSHPQRSVVLEALDGGPGRGPRISCLPARAGDRVLLCSDGLSDLVDDEVLHESLREPDRERCADRLLRQALDAGGRDNVSLVVGDLVPRTDPSLAWA